MVTEEKEEKKEKVVVEEKEEEEEEEEEHKTFYVQYMYSTLCTGVLHSIVSTKPEGLYL